MYKTLSIIGKVLYFYRMILLTFNIVNPEIPFDLKEAVTEQELLNKTKDGTFKILHILDKYLFQATFFVEASLVEKLPELLQTIVKKGHELSLINKNSDQEEMEKAKLFAEEITGKRVRGLRQFPGNRLNSTIVKNLGFIYRSPIDYANIFFYKNTLEKKMAKEVDEMMLVPESVSPYSRVPYNDFTFQMIPLFFYENMINETLKKEDYVMVYLDSWQFVELNHSKFGLPLYRKYNLGKQMENKLDRFLLFLEENEWAVNRMKDFFF